MKTGNSKMYKSVDALTYINKVYGFRLKGGNTGLSGLPLLCFKSIQLILSCIVIQGILSLLSGFCIYTFINI
jgi:hypothetical protein